MSKYSTCTRKQALSKREAEELVIMRFAKKGRHGRAYKCDYCGWYHITKKIGL